MEKEKEIQEIRQLNIIFYSSGSGSESAKINLPKKWIGLMNKDKNNRSVKASFDGERIILE